MGDKLMVFVVLVAWILFGLLMIGFVIYAKETVIPAIADGDAAMIIVTLTFLSVTSLVAFGLLRSARRK
ncbi:hypothetical protein [Luteipulveratus mongoliensis]|uniref:Uncharacterized protein n=1 Tax=Luteipulveratus mongoliensis TaxID=571913 RepID=A0A0K1JN89_9MICO|nr:hypothetical protein [Luteipulveratus mongoliensis]AKU18187.1 hypothetical protein VV02_23950 [Luteipulveratus mongoliensis]